MNAILNTSFEEEKSKRTKNIIIVVIFLLYLGLLLYTVYGDYSSGNISKTNCKTNKHMSILREQIIRTFIFAIVEFALFKSFQNAVIFVLASSIIFEINELFPIYKDCKT